MSLDASASPLVSIVTPAYNEESCLAECIESVLRQSYTNWNYLIVNNCSTDRTLAIAQEYASQDHRIRVVSTQSLIPANANFNFGLRQIDPESRYCKMVLADDWLFPECLTRMVGLMEEHPNVGITGAYGLQGQWVLWEGIPYASRVVSGREICRQRLLGGPYVFGSATSVLFRSDLVRGRDPFYHDLHASDSDACFDLLKTCDFGFVHQVLTFSRVREGSMLEASKELNTSAADMLRELVIYGPFYLSSTEYRQALHDALRRYYDFLATSLLHRRPASFWQYHRRRMREAGVKFSRTALTATVARKVTNRFRLRGGGLERWGL